MPDLYRALSLWFSRSKVRMGLLMLAVLGSLVGLGIHEAMGAPFGKQRAGVMAGSVWLLMLAVVWFDERKKPLPAARAWLLALGLDLFLVVLVMFAAFEVRQP